MLIVENQSELRKIVGAVGAVGTWRAAGASIAFVPTMGNLHDGHVQLVHAARQRAKHTVVSIFVNPLQFNDPNDFAHYPRTLDADRRKLADAGADLLFLPQALEIYPPGEVTRVHVPGLSEILCGAFRPGHFIGMSTVVNKLFNLVQPDVALFGRKDFQQFTIIGRMVRDLALPIELVGIATVREADGLAMSSRNTHLSAAERVRAPELYNSICRARDALMKDSWDIPALERAGMAGLTQAGFKPEYFTVRRAADLQHDDGVAQELVVLAAAWLGKTRLIDNVELRRS